jgi:hypothetical protein
VVFAVEADPYLGRTPHAMSEKLQVIERGSDMVLAAHHTRVGARLVATTVETVRFCPPELVAFQLVRGPVPEVTENVPVNRHLNRDSAGLLRRDGHRFVDGGRMGRAVRGNEMGGHGAGLAW